MPIKILNVREQDVYLSYFLINTSKLKDYTTCNFKQPVINSDSVKKLLSVLNLKGLNREEQISIENICMC